jgi:hypothetical protein
MDPQVDEVLQPHAQGSSINSSLQYFIAAKMKVGRERFSGFFLVNSLMISTLKGLWEG